MPILDPPLQFSLICHNDKEESKNPYYFLLYFLKNASELTAFQSLMTIEASIKFKNDLINLLPFITQILKCEVGKDDLNIPTIKNYFKFIYDRINLPDKGRKRKNETGEFFITTDQFGTRFYKPDVYKNFFHNWFLSDTVIAILKLDLSIDGITDIYKQLIKFEINIMKASSFTLVLITKINSIEHLSFLFELIGENQFSEIHLNITDNTFFSTFLNEFNDKYPTSLDKIKGYLYLYAHFIDPQMIKERTIYKTLKKKFRIKIITYTGNAFDFHKKYKLKHTKPFLFCKDGSIRSDEYLRIRLSNVPLYISSMNTFNITPIKVSGINIGYISPKDFLTWKPDFIKIYFEDESTNTDINTLYIKFDDIHKIRPELYIDNQLLLTKISQSTLDKVKIINSNIEKKKENKKDKFSKEIILSLFKDKKIRDSLEYVAYAYIYSRRLFGFDFLTHQTQIYTAYEACKQFILKKEDPNNKGIVFQVETGEGKTCIVCIIAAALALMKKTVHIASSNIKLSIRDYEESHQFFDLLNIKSAILLHQNELSVSIRKKLLNMKKKKNSKKFNTTNKENSDGNPDNNQEVNYINPDYDFYRDYVSPETKYLYDDSQQFENINNNFYGLDFYDPDLFKNSSKMNFSVCGLDLNESSEIKNRKKANVIFSTFVHFECLYLRMMELSPGSVQKYFQNSGLLIDEADSILIDEITNGTIISRTTKSKLKNVLEFVYDQKKENKSAEDTLQLLKEKFPKECRDLELKHINQMYSEIELVHEPEFENGKKYSIETLEVKNNKTKKRLFKKVINFVSDLAIDVGKGLIKEFTKDDDAENDDDDDDDDDEDDEEEEEENDNSITEFKYIVPFGYNSNGMLEKNKDFNGFIHQFIAIKEWKDNNITNIIIKDMSLSYLYVSHPIFVKLYDSICGFTGTVGNKDDQKIYQNEYKLITKKIPRHNANQNVEFPIMICENIAERNDKIVKEIIVFHIRGYPVLVIFQDLKEIKKVEGMLRKYNIKNINIFDGKNDIVKPDKIAGVEGEITLGTNICGRGTNIKVKGKPLHVIVAYYSSNTRVMQQAFGRTARQGQKGSYRIICLVSQYFNPKNTFNKEIDTAIKDFSIKNQKQQEYVEHFRLNREWIFSGYLDKQQLQKDDILALRQAKINVNRIVAFKYEFPVCMSIETFLRIQIQKIFSILNCPNSQFTWRLFQKYIREMILESWSLMINELDHKYMNKAKGKQYLKELNKNMENLYEILEEYIPNKDYSIVKTFFFIFDKVLTKYQDKVLKGFCKIASPFLQFNKSEFFSCQVGFKPYSLLTKSGARVTNKNFKKTNYIQDPEIKYEKRERTNKITLLSITQKIDDIFEKIFEKVNGILGSKIFLKLFLRRTLGGCEFGFCLNLDLIRKEFGNTDDDDDFYCIIDKDPLLVFTIFVRSLVPVLAIILIFVLVYVASIAKKISKWFTFPSNAKEVIKKTVSVVVDIVSSKISEILLDKVIDFLNEIFENQLKELNNYKEDGIFASEIITKIKQLFDTKAAEEIANNISNHLGNLFEFKTNFKDLELNCLDPVRLMKISVLFILCIATFIINFRFKKMAIDDYSTESKEYNKNCNKEKLKELSKRHEKDVSLKSLNPIDPKLDSEINQSYEIMSKSYEKRMKLCNIFDKLIKIADFQIDNKTLFNTGVSIAQECLLVANKKKCTRMTYKGGQKPFLQQVLFYSTNKFPSIVSFVGYCFDNKNQYIFIDNNEKGLLENYINGHSESSLNLTQKLIIAYGLARAVNHLHNNSIVHRNINPCAVFLDENYYPYLSDFYYAKHIDTDTPYLVRKTKVRFMAPEFLKDYKNNQNSKKIDVFSYGMTLYNLIVESKPYCYESEYCATLNITGGYYPSFYDTEQSQWCKLIERCWEKDPQKRPTFDQICEILESKEFVNRDIDIKAFNNYRKIFPKK